MDSFLEKPSRDVLSDRVGNWMRLRGCGYRTFGIEHARRRVWGEPPGQDVRSATEAAGAANVVDGAPPGERGQRSNGWTTHRDIRVPKNGLLCCDQVAKTMEPGTTPSSLLTRNQHWAASRGSTLRTNGRPAKCPRRRWDPCTGAADRPWRGCASSLPARSRGNRQSSRWRRHLG